MESILGGMAIGLPIAYGFDFFFDYFSKCTDNPFMANFYALMALGLVFGLFLVLLRISLFLFSLFTGGRRII